MKPLSLAIVAALVILGESFVHKTALGQDMVKVAPKDTVKVLLENDRVRVLDYQAGPAGKLAMHSHPAYVTYSFTGGKAKFTSPDGKSTERDMKAGEATWNDGVTHATESTAATHVLIVELKEPQKKE